MSHLDPTYLRYIFDSLEKGTIHAENASELPDGLIGLYEETFDDHLPVLERQYIFRLFTLFALLKKEVSISFLAEVLEDSDENITDFISTYSSWFNSPESGKYQLYHERLKVYVLQKLSDREIVKTHEKLISRLEKAIEEKKADEFEVYSLEFLGEHKLEKALIKKEEFDFIEFAFDPSIWERQIEISKGFSWSRKILEASVVLRICNNSSELSMCILNFLKINLMEQNDFREIIRLVDNNEFELCFQRLNFFGGKSLEQGKRRFLLSLELIKRIMKSNIDINFKKKNISILLEFIETKISSEKYLFNWNEFIHISYVLDIIVSLEKIDVNPVSIVNKSDVLKFEDTCNLYINKSNLKFIYNLIDKSNNNDLDKYNSKINLCEIAVNSQIDNAFILNILNELIDNYKLIKNKITSKTLFSKLIHLLLLTKSYSKIFNSTFYYEQEFREIIINTILIYILEQPISNDEAIKPIISRLHDCPEIKLILNIFQYEINNNSNKEFNLFEDSTFLNMSNRIDLIFSIFVIFKTNKNPKADLYWSQLIFELKNKIKNNSVYSLLSIFKKLVNQDFIDEIQELLVCFDCILDAEIILEFIDNTSVLKNKYLGSLLSKILLKKKNIGKYNFLEPTFFETLNYIYLEDITSAISFINQIHQVAQKDFLFKQILKKGNIDYELFYSYLHFDYFISNEKTEYKNEHLNALKWLDDLKLKDEGLLKLSEVKSKYENMINKPLHFFQSSKDEYLHEIFKKYIFKYNSASIQIFQNLVEDLFVFDSIFFEYNKRTILKNKVEISPDFINKFKTKKLQGQAYLFMSKINYKNFDNYSSAKDIILNIDSLCGRIQGYFDLIEISLFKNDFHYVDFFELVVSTFKKLGNGDIYQRVKDKHQILEILTANSLLLIKIQKNDFLIDQLKFYGLKDRFLSYLKIAEICSKNAERETGLKFFRRVVNQLDKINSISEIVDIRCEIINLCMIFKFKSIGKKNIEVLKEIISSCNNLIKKSEYSLKAIIAFVKIKQYKKAFEFFIFLHNENDKQELYRFIGTYFKSSIFQIFLSDLNLMVRSKSALEEIAKSKISKLKFHQYSDDKLHLAYFVLDESEVLYKLLIGWILNELYVKQVPLKELIKYTKTLNLQWAIDLKNELDMVPN